MSQITELLRGIAQGGGDASAELLPLLYAELRRLAAHKMAHEAAGHNLLPTALERGVQRDGIGVASWRSSRIHPFPAGQDLTR